MSKYIIKAQVSPTGECNPEFAPGKELADGIEADGFLIMTMKDDRPYAATMYGLTTLDLARVLANERSEAGSVIWEAIAIAEGLIKSQRDPHGEQKNEDGERDRRDAEMQTRRTGQWLRCLRSRKAWRS